MSKERGYIKLWRDVEKHPLHPCNQQRPWTEYEAMIDLFLMARGTDNETLLRGQVEESQRQLANRWNWPHSRVRRFFGKLSDSGTATVRAGDPASKNPTQINLCNYNLYNPLPTQSRLDEENDPAQPQASRINDLETVATQTGTVNGTVNGTVTGTVNCLKSQVMHDAATQQPTQSPTQQPAHPKEREKKGKEGEKENTFCTERFQSESSAQSIDIGLPLPGDQGELFLTQAGFEEFRKLYPGVDVMQELRKMRGWLLAKPKKRKTRRGMQAFVNGWLSRAQDNPTRAARKASKDERSAQALRDWISREDS